MEKADIGLIGLGVMGQNLALNLAGKGWKVAVWNRTVPGKEEHIVDNFIAKRAQGKSIVGTQTLEEFVDALKTPKVVFLMVQAGSAVDEMTGRLLPLLHKGDIIIDGGNSNFEDTERRGVKLRERLNVLLSSVQALGLSAHIGEHGGVGDLMIIMLQNVPVAGVEQVKTEEPR